MPTDRTQRRIDAFLDEAEAAMSRGDWAAVRERAHDVLALDEENEDGKSFLSAAERRMAPAAAILGGAAASEAPTAAHLPGSFAAGRYAVRRFLGEGGRKRVYLAHDTRLDREVAFCAIRTEGLDATGRGRVLREAQSMGRLGAHQNLVPIYDIGDDNGTPFIVEEFMGGGDVAALVEKADDHRVPVVQTLAIAKDVCRGLSFIHSGGLIHRDLKPANVFLASDGIAKIGDFGLAVSLDRVRLTQHGMMMGTVSYMPPEQALSGEATPKADLYSLGVMLYEMVTGKPPFVGEDPTAVISQHINTPPVAPSWVTEHCPPALETIILQLLEKDPSKRPDSAQAVLALLAEVDPEAKSATHSDSNVLDRLAKGVFVGRERELDRLRKAFDEAVSGRGGLVMLVGEPGIGKTRTTQELETYARMRGANVIWGRTHEGSGAPAYWPWIQAGRNWAIANDLALIRDDLRSTQGELVRLFPELRDEPEFVEPPPIEDAESARFRLFDAYTMFVRAISQPAPLVIALDDLHWADKPTLLLLQHISRDISHMRVLIVCTYRDTDLTRTHPLSEALASLNREAAFLRIPLRGLSYEEVEGYIRATAGEVPPARVVSRIFDETEGNPFFLAEVVNLMTQEGTLMRESLSDIAVPDGVREALGRRLDRISLEANELLQVCAVVGREFTYDTLTLLGERGEEDLLRLVEEAIGARVIEEMDQPGRYRFTHALMQETLLDELSNTRRVRLHGQVGDALEERWGERAHERASRLAEHFVDAAVLSASYAERALKYARLAAGQAEAQTAWEEASRWYGQALMVLTSTLQPDHALEAALLVSLARCDLNSNRIRDAFRSFMRAVGLYRQSGDRLSAARASLAALEIPMLPGRHWEIVSSALDDVADLEPRLRALLLLANVTGLRRASPLEREAWMTEAKQISIGQQWPDVVARLALAAAWQLAVAGPSTEAAEAFRGAHDLLAAAGDLSRAGSALQGSASMLFASGDVPAGVRRVQETLAFDRRHRLRRGEFQEQTLLAGAALARGDSMAYDAALEAAEGMAWGRLLVGWKAVVESRLTEALAAVPPPDPSIIPAFWGVYWAERSLSLAVLGEHDQAGSELEQCVRLLRENAPLAGPWATAGAVAADTIGVLGRHDLAGEIGSMLRLAGRLTVVPMLNISRVLGDLAVMSGLLDGARAEYGEALALCDRAGLPVELGRCHLGLARVAFATGNIAAALGHLDIATEQFQRYGTKLFLDQVVALKVQLQRLTPDMQSSIVAVSAAVLSEHPDLFPQVAPDGTITLMFSDIENSTPLNERLGDAKYMGLLRQHNALIEAKVRAHRGYVVKTMGDGYMVAFKSAADGVRGAIAIQAAANDLPEGVRVRIGLHTGEMTREGDDFFGRHVNLAARVAGHATGGEILVSGVVHELVAGQGFDFVDGGERVMKGFDEAVRVWVVRS